MSIFITLLAFENADIVNNSKIAILIASLIAGAIGFFWLRFTLSKKGSSTFDQFVLNPSEMYQVTNDGFLYGMGLNMKVALSAIYLRAEAGYQYDMSDSRWKYHGNQINSVGKMNATGGYFELGLGLNYGY